MLEIDLQNKIAPYLGHDEYIIWGSLTDLDKYEEFKKTLKDESRNEFEILAGLVGLYLVLLYLSPRHWPTFTGILIIFATQHIFYFLSGKDALYKSKRFDMGAYALTNSHFYVLDKNLQLKEKYDAHKVRTVKERAGGPLIAPIGPWWSDGYQLQFLPRNVTVEKIQQEIGKARSQRP